MAHAVQEVAQKIEQVRRILTETRDLCQQHKEDFLAGRVQDLLDVLDAPEAPPAPAGISLEEARSVAAEVVQKALRSIPTITLNVPGEGGETVSKTFLTRG